MKYRCLDCDWTGNSDGAAAWHRKAKGHRVERIKEARDSRAVAEKSENGAQNPDGGRGSTALERYFDKKLIPPEAVLKELGWDGAFADEKFKTGVQVGMGLVLLGARYAQVLMGSMAEIMKIQLEIYREAKESAEVAREAASEVAAQIMPQIAEISSKVEASRPAPSSNPLRDMLAEALRPAVNQIVQQFLSFFTGLSPQPFRPQSEGSEIPGFVREKLEEGG